jgi:hypothetical protein
VGRATNIDFSLRLWLPSAHPHCCQQRADCMIVLRLQKAAETQHEKVGPTASQRVSVSLGATALWPVPAEDERAGVSATSPPTTASPRLHPPRQMGTLEASTCPRQPRCRVMSPAELHWVQRSIDMQKSHSRFANSLQTDAAFSRVRKGMKSSCGRQGRASAPHSTRGPSLQKAATSEMRLWRTLALTIKPTRSGP